MSTHRNIAHTHHGYLNYNPECIVTYKFKYTERNAGRAADFETKSLLFLLGIDSDRSKIHYIFIDCFNDVTGSNESCESLWDYQSKGVSNMSPRDLGKALITLFENFLSGFSFAKFSIFIPPPNQGYLKNPSHHQFGIENFGLQRLKIHEGLREEFLRRNSDRLDVVLNSTAIDEFLDIVVFVIDRGAKPDYVKRLISLKDKSVKTDAFYLEIFNEIRAAQSAKKFKSIHGAEVAQIADTLHLEKHLRARDIHVLVINRLVGADLFKDDAIPIGFYPEISGKDHNDIQDILTDCSIRISRAFFDKNSKASFWKFLEASILKTSHSPSRAARAIYEDVVSEGAAKCRHLNEYASIFLISILQQGLRNESN